VTARKRTTPHRNKRGGAPTKLDRRALIRLLAAGKGGQNLGARVEAISRQLIGLPYIENPLGGGPDLEERLTLSLGAFDCVTFVESVLAAALAQTPGDFVSIVREIRYHRGCVEWASRNHYMTDWVRNNRKQGFVADKTRGRESITKERRLNLVAGLPKKMARLRCFPKRAFPRIAPRIESGDVIFFVSTRPTLDVFHTGLLVKRGDEVLMRHAARGAGKVIEQPLPEFLKTQRMAGFMLARPVMRSGARGGR